MELTVLRNKREDLKARGTELDHHKKITNKENKDKNVDMQLAKKRLQILVLRNFSNFMQQVLIPNPNQNLSHPKTQFYQYRCNKPSQTSCCSRFLCTNLSQTQSKPKQQDHQTFFLLFKLKP